MKKAITAVLCLALLIGGCIVTGNTVILIGVGDFTGTANESFIAESVNLLDYSDYVDHRDDINSIDDIGFVCRVQNTGANAATGRLYIYEEGGLTTIPELATVVLDGIKLAPGETREITLDQSYDYLKNFEEVRKIVLSEKFTIYFTSTTTPFTLDVDDMVIVLSVNGKP